MLRAGDGDHARQVVCRGDIGAGREGGAWIALAVLVHDHETFIRPAPALAYRTYSDSLAVNYSSHRAFTVWGHGEVDLVALWVAAGIRFT